MQEIIIEIKIIEEHYVEARYLEAYQSLRQLCCDNKHCEEFSQAAIGILSQYNDLENSIMTTISLELGQQDLKKRQICVAFEKLMTKMKRHFNPQLSGSTYKEQTIRMRAHRDMLLKSLIAVENDISDCDNPQKKELLEQIEEQLGKMIKYFRNLITSFRAVINYE